MCHGLCANEISKRPKLLSMSAWLLSFIWLTNQLFLKMGRTKAIVFAMSNYWHNSERVDHPVAIFPLSYDIYFRLFPPPFLALSLSYLGKEIATVQWAIRQRQEVNNIYDKWSYVAPHTHAHAMQSAFFTICIFSDLDRRVLVECAILLIRGSLNVAPVHNRCKSRAIGWLAKSLEAEPWSAGVFLSRKALANWWFTTTMTRALLVCLRHSRTQTSHSE